MLFKNKPNIAKDILSKFVGKRIILKEAHNANIVVRRHDKVDIAINV